MKKVFLCDPGKVILSAADLENANLNEWERLELHLLDQAAVVIPGVMTVMEIIRTAEALQGLASELLACIGVACEKCDGCQVELLCDLMKGEIRPEVSIPPQVLNEAGMDPDSKLAYEVDSESGEIRVVAADYRYDLSNIPRTLLETFRECGLCLADLDAKVKAEEAVYGVDAAEAA